MSSLTSKRQPEAKLPTYDGSLAAKEITTDKQADSVKEKWSENLACCHTRLYLNACAAHDSFLLSTTHSRQSVHHRYQVFIDHFILALNFLKAKENNFAFQAKENRIEQLYLPFFLVEPNRYDWLRQSLSFRNRQRVTRVFRKTNDAYSSFFEIILK